MRESAKILFSGGDENRAERGLKVFRFSPVEPGAADSEAGLKIGGKAADLEGLGGTPNEQNVRALQRVPCLPD